MTITHEQGKKLLQALDQPGKERIKDLAKNPLRLVLLCSTWKWWKGRLPDTRAELYRGFTQKFYEWKRDEFETTLQQQDELNLALGKLALIALDQKDSRFLLTTSILHDVLGRADGPLFRLITKLGWLNQVGLSPDNPDEAIYAFFHPTFQEYFASTAINDYQFLLKYNSNNPIKGDYRIFGSQWREVILLWFGRKGETTEQKNKLTDQKERFISELINFDDKCGKFYTYRAYFLAAISILEFKESKFADTIVAQVIDWCLNPGFPYHLKIEAEAKLVKTAKLVKNNRRIVVADLTKRLSNPIISPDNLEKLVQSLSLVLPTSGGIGGGGMMQDSNGEVVFFDVPTPIVQEKSEQQKRDEVLENYIIDIIRLISLVGINDKDAINSLVLIVKDRRSGILLQAVKSLGEIAINNSEAQNALISLLESSNKSEVSDAVLASLCQIAPTSPDTSRVLSNAIHNIERINCIKAIELLQKIASINSGALSALINLLKSDSSYAVRLTSAQKLSEIVPDNLELKNFLMNVISNHDIDIEQRLACAKTLSNIKPDNLELKNFLMNVISNHDIDIEQRLACSKTLSNIEPHNQEVIRIYTDWLNLDRLISVNDENPELPVAKLLWEYDPGNTGAFNAFINALITGFVDYEKNFENALDTIKSISVYKQCLLEKFIGWLPQCNEDCKRWQVTETMGRWRLSKAIEELDPGNLEVVNLLIDFLLEFESPKDKLEVNKRLLEIAERSEIGRSRVTKALVKLLHSNEDDTICITAISLLGQIGTNDPESIQSLTKLLNDKSRLIVRSQLAIYLYQIDSNNSDVLAVLREFLDYKSCNLNRQQFFEGLKQVGDGNLDNASALIQMLSQNAKALKQLGIGDPSLINIMVYLVKNNHENPNIIDAVIDLLIDGQNKFVSLQAALSLGKSNLYKKKVVETLIDLLDVNNTELDSDVNNTELDSDVNNTELDSDVNNTELDIDDISTEQLDQSEFDENICLLEMVSNGLNLSIYQQAAIILGNIDPGNSQAIASLLNLIHMTSAMIEQLKASPDVQIEQVTQLEMTLLQLSDGLTQISKGNLEVKTELISIVINLLNNSESDVICTDALRILGQIGKDNSQAINSLIDVLYETAKELPYTSNIMESIYRTISPRPVQKLFYQAKNSLINIGSNNSDAIKALVSLIPITQGSTNSLKDIGIGNRAVVENLLDLLRNSASESVYWQEVVDLLLEVLQADLFAVAINRLRPHLISRSYESNSHLYRLLSHCAQRMSYPAFYAAWQDQGSAGIQNLKSADLPNILKDAIENELELNLIVHVVCIDISRFLNPDNPSTKIYTDMVRSGLPKCSDGTPKSMIELQSYWDILSIETNKKIVLLFHKNNSSLKSQNLSETFLETINSFDGLIGLISDQPFENFDHKQLSFDSNLIENILEWIRADS